MLANSPGRTLRATTNRKRPNRVSKSAAPLRRSARLQRIEPPVAALPRRRERGNPQKSDRKCKKEEAIFLQDTQLPSQTHNAEARPDRKRKLPSEDLCDDPAPKAPRVCEISQCETAAALEEICDPVKSWVYTGYWPKRFARKLVKMPSQDSSKRRTSSLHRSELKRQRAEQGVFMKQSPHLSRQSKEMCETLLGGEYELVACTLYPESALSDVLEHVQSLNETRIQRDVMPRVVPPAEILRFHRQPILPSICEDLNALWCYCQPKGGSIPKPDYTAGLSQDAFSKEEIRRLKNHSTFHRPFLFTPDVCFPFLTCEAKSGDQAMSRAQSQNMGSGSVAVSAVIELYKAAFGRSEPRRVRELYGKILAFSVSHDHRVVTLWGHYVVMDDTENEEKFYYHELDTFSLTVGDGRDKNKAYNFVRGVYEKFAPEHLRRIKEAAAGLPAVGARTGLSFAASELGLDEAGSLPNSQEGSQEGVFHTPKEPASTTKAREQMERQMEQQREQMKQQRQDSKEKEERLERQMEQQRQDSKEKEERLERQMEQQRQDSKKKEERLERQMQHQQEQIDKMMEMISLFKQPQDRLTRSPRSPR